MNRIKIISLRHAALAAACVLAGPALAQEYVPFGPRPSTEGLPQDTWVGGVQLTFGHDDNVPPVSDTRLFFAGEEDANFLQFDAAAQYWTELGNGMRFGTILMGSYRDYPDVNPGTPLSPSLDWYGNGSLHAKVYVEADIETGLGLLTIAPSYGFRYEVGADDRIAALGLSSHQLALDGTLAMTDDFSLHFGAARRWLSRTTRSASSIPPAIAMPFITRSMAARRSRCSAFRR